MYTLNQLTAPWEALFESNRDWIYRFLRTIHKTTLRLFLFLYIVHYQIFKTNFLNSLPILTRKCLFNAKCNIMVLKIIRYKYGEEQFYSLLKLNHIFCWQCTCNKTLVWSNMSCICHAENYCKVVTKYCNDQPSLIITFYYCQSYLFLIKTPEQWINQDRLV